VTDPAIRERLDALGFPPARIDPVVRLVDAAADLCVRTAGGRPEHAWWVPGRLEVFGKHTDYAGGHSLVCAVPRGFAIAARARADTAVRLMDAVRGETFVVEASKMASGPPDDGPLRRSEPGDSPSGAGWRNYVQTVVRRLARNFPDARIGADIAIASDLPSASGMSSSSALVTGVAVALVRLAGLRERAEWQQAIRTTADEAGYYACIENGMAFGPLEGDQGVGTHGGSEDHAAIVCGRPGELTAWRFAPIEEVGRTPLPADWMFVIAASGVAARKTGEARDAYNQLSSRVRRLLDLWRRQESDAQSLAAALRSSPGAAHRLLSLVREDEEAAQDDLERRLRHFVEEDARVLDALDACRRADRARLGWLSERSQAEAESLLGNHVPETVSLARRARDLGASAASSFGAGFGGSVWAVVQRDDAQGFADAWLADYRARFPGRTAATTFTMRPGPGVAQII
jgi:galactokinase